MKYDRDIIVGIDPGVTTAYSMLDFDGKLIELGSKKYFSKNSLIALITNKGKVRIIATDVVIIPHLVLDIAKKLRATIIKPSKDIGAIKKKKLAKEFLRENYRKLKIKNKHELAALCASIIAYKHFSPLLNKIKHQIKKEKVNVLVSLLTKKSANIKEALRSI